MSKSVNSKNMLRSRWRTRAMATRKVIAKLTSTSQLDSVRSSLGIRKARAMLSFSLISRVTDRRQDSRLAHHTRASKPRLLPPKPTCRNLNRASLKKTIKKLRLESLPSRRNLTCFKCREPISSKTAWMSCQVTSMKYWSSPGRKMPLTPTLSKLK